MFLNSVDFIGDKLKPKEMLATVTQSLLLASVCNECVHHDMEFIQMWAKQQKKT